MLLRTDEAAWSVHSRSQAASGSKDTKPLEPAQLSAGRCWPGPRLHATRSHLIVTVDVGSAAPGVSGPSASAAAALAPTDSPAAAAAAAPSAAVGTSKMGSPLPSALLSEACTCSACEMAARAAELNGLAAYVLGDAGTALLAPGAAPEGTDTTVASEIGSSVHAAAAQGCDMAINRQACKFVDLAEQQPCAARQERALDCTSELPPDGKC